MGFEIKRYHGNYNRVRRVTTVRYVVVHYVGAGTSAPGNALANCKYFSGGNRNASAHYFIDDANIYEYADPSTYATWHCGDGHGRYGITNQNSVGIEVCNNGGPYTQAEIERLAWLVQKLMSDFGVPASRVVRHYDASRKQCPLYYVQHGDAWAKLQAQITGNAALDGGGSSPNGTLEVDGYWGEATTRKLQEYFGTPQDGVVSSQDAHWKVRNGGLTSGWEWLWHGVGSQLIAAMQCKLGIDDDGFFGPATANALIARYAGETNCIQDGKLDAGSATIKAMQRRLNAGSF